MRNSYQTVKFAGDDRIHVTKEYGREVPHALCSFRTYNRECNTKEITTSSITKVNRHPTCQACAWEMLRELNNNSSSIKSWKIINRAYDQIFGRSICEKGKCDSLHRDAHKSNHNYPYIPNNSRSIARELSDIFRFITDKRNIDRFTNKRSPLRFLDAGCGIGNIVTLASAIGFTAHGIELNTAYLKIARRLTASLRYKPYLKQADIITFDKYHTYDLIYYYVPIADVALQTAFEVHLIRNMKVGAFMFPTGSSKGACEAESEGYFERVIEKGSQSVFEKVLDVPKDWVPKRGYLRKEYERYIGSFLGKKSISMISGGNNHVSSIKKKKRGKNRKK